jgi:Protein of unknown function (DUF2750)
MRFRRAVQTRERRAAARGGGEVAAAAAKPGAVLLEVGELPRGVHERCFALKIQESNRMGHPVRARERGVMSLSGAHRAAFRREAAREGRVFSIRDAAGLPAPVGADGRRTVPFWSKPTRAGRVVDQVQAYRGFEVVGFDVDEWLGGWLGRLETDGMLVGVNWSGARATGFDVAPAQVRQWFAEDRELGVLVEEGTPGSG